MWYLIWMKTPPGHVDPTLICRGFASRKELLLYATSCNIKLHAYRSIIVGPNGEERGSPDPYEELEKIETAERREAMSEVKDG